MDQRVYCGEGGGKLASFFGIAGLILRLIKPVCKTGHGLIIIMPIEMVIHKFCQMVHFLFGIHAGSYIVVGIGELFAEKRIGRGLRPGKR